VEGQSLQQKEKKKRKNIQKCSKCSKNTFFAKRSRSQWVKPEGFEDAGFAFSIVWMRDGQHFKLKRELFENDEVDDNYI